MMLIVFILLVVIAIAVGVRIVETGSKIGLVLVLLVAAGLGLRLVTQSPVVKVDTDRQIMASEGQIEEDADRQVVSEQDRASESVVQTERAPDAAEGSKADVVTAEDVPAEIDLKNEVTDNDQVATGTGEGDEIQLAGSTPPKVRVRPEWLEWDDLRPSEVDGVDKLAVCSGPQEHMGQCRPALDQALEQSVSDYIDQYLGRVYGENFKASSVLHYDADYIRKNLVTETFDDKEEFFFGPMYQSHALIAFTPAFRQVLDGQRAKVDQQWQQVVVGSRLGGIALVFGVILAFLAVISGYFRLDTATRGFYTARLQFLAAVAILAVIVAGALLARNVHWM